MCASPVRDETTLLRCAVLTLLRHGCFMAADEIPLPEILSAAGDNLRRLAAPPFGDETDPVPTSDQWAWVEAEVRLAVARAAGLDAVSTLAPRIDRVLTKAARRSARHHDDLLDRAARQFAEQHSPPSRTP
ncbi:hypothetical protein T261_0834 [Streptomyces lydicus]|nr:hypothetical protein T261_0834 [Streptomyces lydicus]